jgi:hypothetical protein
MAIDRFGTADAAACFSPEIAATRYAPGNRVLDSLPIRDGSVCGPARLDSLVQHSKSLWLPGVARPSDVDRDHAADRSHARRILHDLALAG